MDIYVGRQRISLARVRMAEDEDVLVWPVSLDARSSRFHRHDPQA